jgi:predicted transcriptional regulator
LGISATAVNNRLRALVKAGLLVEIEKREGMPKSYRLADDHVLRANMLPTPDRLREFVTADCHDDQQEADNA